MIKLPPAAKELIDKLTNRPARSSQESDETYSEGLAPSGGFAAPVFQKLRMAMPKGMSVDLRMGEVARYFSGAIFEKVIATLDKTTLLIIGTAWLAAIVSMGLAFVAVRDTSQLKLKVDVARALDPVLPKIVRMPLTKEQYDPLLHRLRKQFPTLAIDITQKPTLHIQSNNPDEFMSWLNAVSYVDSMISTVRWTLTTFCVGVECQSDNVMEADLAAESINITQPEAISP